MEVFVPAEGLMGSAEGFRSGVTPMEPKEGTLQHYLRKDDASNERSLGNRSSQYLTLDRGAKFEVQKAGRLFKCNDGLTKRLGMVTSEISKTKDGLLDVNRLYPESASSPASSKFSEKTQPIIKGTTTGRRGHKRNSKPQKNRGDSFSLKNGLVGFHTASGGNDYLGMYGLKHNAFDVTKHIKELSLDDLLRGSYKFSNIAVEKAKEAAGSSVNLLETLENVSQVLEDKKVLQAQKCVDVDESCIANVPTSLEASIGQTDNENGNSFISDPPSSDKVMKLIEKTTTNVADLSLYKPKDVLQRLSLSPPPKDLDSLLSDAGKTISSKHSADPNIGKPVSQRNGLPPLPWSSSSSGNGKLTADAAKMSLNRTICHGKWIKMENSLALQKSSDDNFLSGFESLMFNGSLVPSLTVAPTRPETEVVASADTVLPASDTFSDVPSPEHVAAQIILELAKCSKQSPHEPIKLLKKPLHIPTKSRLAPERSIKFIDPPRSTKFINPLKNSDNGFPSKKLKISSTIRHGVTNHIEPARKGPLHFSGPSCSSSSPMRSSGKLGRDSTVSGRDSYGAESFKKPLLTKPPKETEPPRSSNVPGKFRNPLQ